MLGKQEGAGSKLLDVQCRKTLCRLLVRHTSLTDKKRFASSLEDAEPFRGSMLFRHGDENSGTPLETSLYVVRDGYNVQGDQRSVFGAF
jgi:hypothetical protein